jgi:hypothetical protein
LPRKNKRIKTGARITGGLQMQDPTYVKELIEDNEIWRLAFLMSEIDNDNAPVGWGKYIHLARYLLDKYELKLKQK